ncbi:MAG TPA: DUF4386 domain-containing protein [Gemmatimonadales bacterium]|jgi:uncharacterized membrane protein|nr:DUF4386 domain-containing protein [Gemmatimonadales bacterium]
MTRTTNARLAGFAFLFYIAVGVPAMILMSRATNGDGIVAKLASVAQHVGDVRLAMVLSLLGSCSALVLAVTLYAITREQDAELAMLGMACRLTEGVAGAVSLTSTLGLLGLVANQAGAPDAAKQTLGAFLLGDSPLVAATFFAFGSTFFAYLLLRGRMIPIGLAWLGLAASVLLAVGLPLQLGGLLQGPATRLIWFPMLAFEVPLGLWLLIKGVK